MISFLVTLQFILAAIIAIAVLLQKSSSIGLGAYSGSNDSVFGAKGPNAFMSKFTFIIGIIFVLNTIFLGYQYNKSKKSSIAEEIRVTKAVPTSGDSSVPSNIPSAPKQ